MILDGCIIKLEKVVIPLGIHIDENLNFLIYTEKACKKADRQLSALRRLSFYHRIKAKLAIFKALILRHFQCSNCALYGKDSREGFKVSLFQSYRLI